MNSFKHSPQNAKKINNAPRTRDNEVHCQGKVHQQTIFMKKIIYYYKSCDLKL